MSQRTTEAPVEEKNDATTPESAEATRRQFLRQLAIAGAGVAGLTLLSEESASAAPPVELILGTYTLTNGLTTASVRIASQSGITFIGRFDDGTTFAGTVAGATPGTINLYFTRTTLDGSFQIYSGAATTRGTGAAKVIFLAGTYTHNGSGPYPWSAEGTSGG